MKLEVASEVDVGIIVVVVVAVKVKVEVNVQVKVEEDAPVLVKVEVMTYEELWWLMNKVFMKSWDDLRRCEDSWKVVMIYEEL